MKEYSITKIVSLTVMFFCLLLDVVDGTPLGLSNVITIGLLLGLWGYYTLYLYGTESTRIALLNQVCRRYDDTCWYINPKYVWFTWVQK